MLDYFLKNMLMFTLVQYLMDNFILLGGIMYFLQCDDILLNLKFTMFWVKILSNLNES